MSGSGWRFKGFNKNIYLYGNKEGIFKEDPGFESFEKHVLPVLLEREYGVIAMKTMAGGSLMGGRIDTTPADIATKDIPDVVGMY